MNVFESLYFKKKRKAKTALFPLTRFQPSPNPFSLILFLSRGPNSLLLFFFRPETFSSPAQFSSPAHSFFLAQSVAPSPLSLADVRGPPVSGRERKGRGVGLGFAGEEGGPAEEFWAAGERKMKERGRWAGLKAG